MSSSPALMAAHLPGLELAYWSEHVTLYRGDAIEALAQFPTESAGAIITDPPYPKEYLPLYAKMAFQASVVLKTGGSLLSILPHYAMPTLLNEMSTYLKWRWILAMWQEPGPHARMSMGIEVLWKPIGWWVKGSWPRGRAFRKDGFINPRPAKKLHVWQQHLAWARYCMQFTQLGDTVIDPFIGTGTTALAAMEMGRKCIGIDNDPKAIDTAIDQIEAKYNELGTYVGEH